MHLTENPFRILLHAWARGPLTFFIRDAVVNVALYVPLGFMGHLAFKRVGLQGFPIYGPVLLGLSLSVTIELLQLLVPTRTTSMIDVTNNVIGSGLGVAVGLLFDRAGFRQRNKKKKRVPDRAAAFLVLCWAAWLLFPLFPIVGFYTPSRKFLVFLHAGWLDPVALASLAASFFAGALLIARAGWRLPRPWLFATVLVIPAQIFLAGRQPVASELAGAVAGVALFAARRGSSKPTKTEAWLFSGLLVLRGLAPFHFSPAASGFDWIPFEATLTGDWQAAAAILLEKIFFYGTAIWLLHAAGSRMWRAVPIVASILAMIEIAQTHLPGRSAEITDPVLAMLIGFVLATLSRHSTMTASRKHALSGVASANPG